MPMNKDIRPCDLLLHYYLNELDDEQRQLFQQHAADCPSCQTELQEMDVIWQELPFTMETYEPPAELKDEVMNAIFGSEAGGEPEQADPRAESQGAGPAAVSTIRENSRYFKLRRRFAAAAAGIVLLGGGYTLGEWTTHSPSSHQAAGSESRQSWSLKREVALKSTDPALVSSQGSVWLMQQDEGTQVVLHASGLRETKGDESYQMWMIRDGKRWSCGTFQVGEDGSGMLLYTMKSGAQFDSIGITLEPDAAGKQPRGPKVLGSG